jgi:hypothetical protein
LPKNPAAVVVESRHVRSNAPFIAETTTLASRIVSLRNAEVAVVVMRRPVIVAVPTEAHHAVMKHAV